MWKYYFLTSDINSWDGLQTCFYWHSLLCSNPAGSLCEYKDPMSVQLRQHVLPDREAICSRPWLFLGPVLEWRECVVIRLHFFARPASVSVIIYFTILVSRHAILTRGVGRSSSLLNVSIHHTWPALAPQCVLFFSSRNFYFVLLVLENSEDWKHKSRVVLLHMPIQKSLSRWMNFTSILDYVFISIYCLITNYVFGTSWWLWCSIPLIINQEHQMFLYEALNHFMRSYLNCAYVQGDLSLPLFNGNHLCNTVSVFSIECSSMSLDDKLSAYKIR